MSYSVHKIKLPEKSIQNFKQHLDSKTAFMLKKCTHSSDCDCRKVPIMLTKGQANSNKDTMRISKAQLNKMNSKSGGFLPFIPLIAAAIGAIAGKGTDAAGLRGFGQDGHGLNSFGSGVDDIEGGFLQALLPFLPLIGSVVGPLAKRVFGKGISPEQQGGFIGKILGAILGPIFGKGVSGGSIGGHVSGMTREQQGGFIFGLLKNLLGMGVDINGAMDIEDLKKNKD